MGEGIMSRLLLAMWHGEKSLRSTFWYYGLAGTVLVYILFATLILVVESFSPLPTWPLVNIATIMVLCLPITVYPLAVSVAVWRSANRYPGPRVYRLLARAIAAITMVGVLMNLPQFSYSSKTFFTRGPVRSI
jgi:hypothetical protein